MLSEQPPAQIGHGDASSDQQLSVNLQIVSPSPGVARPLLYPGLSASTTIKQLKERIRDSLPIRPADEHQRLIHRGRAILRDTDSLLDIIGADALRNQPDQHTIHLVLRDASHAQSPQTTTSSITTATSQGPPPAASHQPQNAPRAASASPAFAPQHQLPGLTRRTPFQTTSPLIQPRGPSPAPNPHAPATTAADQAAAFQQQHQNMTSWLTQIQREAMARAAINQNQRGRATFGLRGFGDTAPLNNEGHRSGSNSGRASPVLPVLNPGEIRNFLRAVDPNHAAGPHNILRRSASNSSLQNRPPSQPSALPTSFFASGAGPRTSAGRATPDYGLRTPSAGQATYTTASAHTQQPVARPGLEFYLLSSPEGPRFIVLNSAATEVFCTPRLAPYQTPQPFRQMAPLFSGHPLPQDDAAAQNLSSFIRTPYLAQNQQPFYQQQLFQQQPLPLPQAQQHQHQQHLYQHQQQAQPAYQQQQTPQPQPQPQQRNNQQQQQPHMGLHPNNPVVGAIPALVLQILPHFWLIVRLALFVWLFASPTNSWSRWLTMISLAVFLFALSTGILNGLAEHAWRPLGRHLENVFPAAEYARLQRGAQEGGAPGGRDQRAETAEGQQQQQQQQQQQPADPDPSRMAARLVVEHRERRSWFMGHARRVERAFLLFVASIAPGIAERHIAHLEAEARAEEARRREAEAQAAAAATAAAAAASATAAAEGGITAQSTGADAMQTGGDENPRQRQGVEQQQQQQRAHLNVPAQEDLIAF